MSRPVVLVSLLLAACGGGRDQHGVGPPPPTTRAFQQCTSELLRAGVQFRPLPDQRFGGGCSALGAVQLRDIGVPVANLGAMRCGLAAKFAAWVREDVAAAARDQFGSQLVRIESFGSYACRNVVGAGGASSAAGRLSGHAIANAVDVGGFVLADGRRINVLGGWTSPDPAVADFLRTIRRAACRRFGTVLSPDYNAAHANHLHLEDDGAGFCR